jgi:methionine-S-sulfoxide reductase
MRGVTATGVGYAGGHVPDPSYRTVCGKDTGHAEVVIVEFSPEETSYEELLAAFFAMHDACRWNPGGQYRSAVFALTDAQEEVACAYLARLRQSDTSVRTEVTRIDDVWPAEEYHQQFADRGGIRAAKPGREFATDLKPTR